MSILVVEDDPAAAECLTGMLSGEGYADVVVVSSISAAVGWLDTRSATLPELIVLDLGLPDGNGLELCRRLKRVRRFAPVPVMVVSAVDDDGTIEEALDAGAADYVRKPVRPRELAGRVRAALRSKRATEALSREHQLVGITERLRKTNEALVRLSGTDPLTNIANRRQFNIVYRNEWRRASRGSLALGLAVFDVDDFHAYNEHYGHLAGDQCLVAVAGAIAGCVHRPSDLVARYGGDELVFVLPDTDLEGGRRVAERARAAVAALAIPHARSRCAPHVTVSAGVASLLPRSDLAPEVLFTAADEALLRAKQRGRNQVDAGAPEEPDAAVEVEVDPILARRIPAFLANRRQDVRALREAVDRGAFDTIGRLAHNLKGTGASYGFDLITEVGRSLEEAARGKDSEAIRRAVADLDRYLDRVRAIPLTTPRS